MPSQCLLARTLSKKQTMMSVTTKVALQLNCKLGGELWALEIPVSKGRKGGRKGGGGGESEGEVLVWPVFCLKHGLVCFLIHTGLK